MNQTRPIALVTGAGRATGVGFEVARQPAQSGFMIVLTARDHKAARARAAELREQTLALIRLGQSVRPERVEPQILQHVLVHAGVSGGPARPVQPAETRMNTGFPAI